MFVEEGYLNAIIDISKSPLQSIFVRAGGKHNPANKVVLSSLKSRGDDDCSVCEIELDRKDVFKLINALIKGLEALSVQQPPEIGT